MMNRNVAMHFVEYICWTESGIGYAGEREVYCRLLMNADEHEPVLTTDTDSMGNLVMAMDFLDELGWNRIGKDCTLTHNNELYLVMDVWNISGSGIDSVVVVTETIAK